MTEQANLKFGLRQQAQDFSRAWAFYSKRGHIMGSGLENVTVLIFDVTEQDKIWIDQYIEKNKL